MAMLADILSRLLSKSGIPQSDQNVVPPDLFMQSKEINSNPKNITNDSGDIVGYDTNDWSKGNPFSKLIETSRSNNNTGPGVLRQLLSSVIGGGLQPGTGTVGGGGPPDHTPGTQQDAALNPTPFKSQRQRNLAPMPAPQAVPTPPDYSMPQALDHVSIEELRTSLLTQAGQMDINNPNGLSGRMNSPNSNVDQRSQMNEAQQHSDSLRGFDGSRNQKIKDANNGR